MEFLKSSKRRSLLSELIYIILNIALAVAILAVVLAIDSPWPAFGLVVLSKWRILAVRPRFWFANIQANMVDVIVSLSVVMLLFAANGSFALQSVLTLLYIIWLLFIKPRSKRVFVALQAGIAVFLGITALFSVSFDWIASLVVIGMWLIGYSAARHVLGSHEDPHMILYSLIWGLFFAELGWLGYHWTFAYTLPGTASIRLSQMAIIATVISFFAERAYSSYSHHGTIRPNDILLPGLLMVSVVLVLLVFFNRLGVGVI